MRMCTKVGWLEVTNSVEGRQRDSGPESRTSPVKVGLLELMSVVRSITISAIGYSHVNLAPHILARYFPKLQNVTFLDSFAHVWCRSLAHNADLFFLEATPKCPQVILTGDEISRLQNELHFPGNKRMLFTATGVVPLAEQTIVFGNDSPAVEVYREVMIRCRSIQQAQGSNASSQVIKATLLKLVFDVKTEELVAARVHIV
ncbi:hypothetical protein LTR70_007289 [Exophiala xenobiotica]|nr:hypothetical protein LTR70_007289 [Exophiala xenobiotica]